MIGSIDLHRARSRRSPPEAARERRDASRALAVAVVLQGVHVGKEATVGFHQRLQDLFNLPPMSYSFFVMTSPFVALASAWLGLRLVRATRGRRRGEARMI